MVVQWILYVVMLLRQSRRSARPKFLTRNSRSLIDKPSRANLNRVPGLGLLSVSWRVVLEHDFDFNGMETPFPLKTMSSRRYFENWDAFCSW